jgi:hypothetical protein
LGIRVKRLVRVVSFEKDPWDPTLRDSLSSDWHRWGKESLGQDNGGLELQMEVSWHQHQWARQHQSHHFLGMQYSWFLLSDLIGLPEQSTILVVEFNTFLRIGLPQEI